MNARVPPRIGLRGFEGNAQFGLILQDVESFRVQARHHRSFPTGNPAKQIGMIPIHVLNNPSSSTQKMGWGCTKSCGSIQKIWPKPPMKRTRTGSRQKKTKA
jgi:hypothetical protein